MRGPESDVRKLINIGGLVGEKVNISHSLDEVINELLAESTLKSGKNKKRGAELRLEDRLRRLSFIPAEEQYIEKKVS